MKKKLIAVFAAAIMMIALPMTAFGAPSPSGDVKNYPTDNGDVIVDFSQVLGGSVKNDLMNNLVVSSNNGTPELQASAGSGAQYFGATAGGIIDNFGTLTISFPVGAGTDGVVYKIYQHHEDGTIQVYYATAKGGYVSVSVTKLSNFAVVADGSPEAAKAAQQASASGSGTSPQTGATETSSPLVPLTLGTVTIIAAGIVIGTALHVKKSQQ